MIPLVLFLGLGIGIAALVTWGAKHAAKTARERADALMNFGSRYGMRMVDQIKKEATHWKFTREPINFSARDEYPSIGIFKIYNCQYSNVLQGKDDRGQLMRTFDAQYTVSTGKSSHTYYYSVASVNTNTALPEIAIQREGLWDKVKRLFGTSDIHTGNQVFDDMFRVESNDEPFARSLLMSEMQDRIAAQPFTGIYITGGQATVVKLGLAKPEELDGMLNLASTLAEKAVRPDEISRVRYALEHSGPAPISPDDHSIRELDEI